MAPSPTGFFHVGSARTALYNYLFARHHNGTFVLRVEDTDMQRNAPEYEQTIYDAMAWLGLKPDESPLVGGAYGPYRQSERFDIYREYADKLVAAGAAYPAYETTEELAAMKAEQQAQKLPPRYSGAHRDLSPEQRATFAAEGRQAVLRLRVPDGETTWDDVVRGNISWQNKEIDDFVIMKSDGSPAYNFACVVDDALMKITHVIRGEDGISNTPRQLIMYSLLGFEAPLFAHLPLLLGRDRSKLSKRHGPVSLLEYPAQGVLPQAMFNYLALLGWNPGEGETQEIFSHEELIEKFTLENVNKSGAIFDVEKLAHINTEYLRSLPIAEFAELAKLHLPPFELDEYALRSLDLARERVRTVAESHDIVNAEGKKETVVKITTDISGPTAYFLTDDFTPDEAGAAKHLNDISLPRLRQLRERLAAMPEWNHDAIEQALRSLAEDLKIKPAELIHPARMAVSGRTVGPSIFELLDVLGRERVLRRLLRTAP